MAGFYFKTPQKLGKTQSVKEPLHHTEQVGFMKGRNWEVHILWKVRNNAEPIGAFLLDAEKAFDKVDFVFLFYNLKQFVCVTSSTEWVKTLYTDPKATVLTIGIMSSTFKLGWDTRQRLSQYLQFF